MPKVLVIGATGYIGSALCDTLVRSGVHTVYGLVRSPAKAPELARREITPVVGSISDSGAYADLVRRFEVDIIVNAATFSEETTKLLDDVVVLGEERLATYKRNGVVGGPKLGFVATTGMWIHGASPERVDDLMPVGNKLAKASPVAMVGGFPAFEQRVLGATGVLDVMVIRPPLNFGREATIWGALFGPILGAAMQGSTEALHLDVDPDSIICLAHVDDIAAGLELAVNKLPLLSGTSVYPVFDLVAIHVSLRLALEGAARAFGFKGQLEFVKPVDNLFMEALSTSVNSTSARARQLLGWQPRRLDFLENIDIYALAFKAGQMTGK